MPKKKDTKKTLADLVAKKKEKKKELPLRGEFYSETEDFTFEFKKCDEELFFYIMDKYPQGFKDDTNVSELVKAFDNLIYECVVIDGKTLKDKEVREMLGVDESDKINLISNSAKALIESFTDRLKLGTEILEFSGFSDGNNQVEAVKN